VRFDEYGFQRYFGFGTAQEMAPNQSPPKSVVAKQLVEVNRIFFRIRVDLCATGGFGQTLGQSGILVNGRK
jgi:hypothetical protein